MVDTDIKALKIYFIFFKGYLKTNLRIYYKKYYYYKYYYDFSNKVTKLMLYFLKIHLKKNRNCLELYVNRIINFYKFFNKYNPLKKEIKVKIKNYIINIINYSYLNKLITIW